MWASTPGLYSTAVESSRALTASSATSSRVAKERFAPSSQARLGPSAVDDALSTPAGWVEHEDSCERQERIRRLSWLAKRAPQSIHWIFHDGLASRVLFEEARYCFVYGQFVAVILLGVAFVERSLAARIYGMGSDSLERAHLPSLLPVAQERGWLTQDECARLNSLRDARNPLVHFRRPMDPSRFEWKAVLRSMSPYDLLEEDARAVLDAVFHYLERSSI
jgi:hypothetical protein